MFGNFFFKATKSENSNTPLIVKVCNRFSVGVNNLPLREIEVYLLPLIARRCNCFSVDAIEC